MTENIILCDFLKRKRKRFSVISHSALNLHQRKKDFRGFPAIIDLEHSSCRSSCNEIIETLQGKEKILMRKAELGGTNRSPEKIASTSIICLKGKRISIPFLLRDESREKKLFH